MTRTVSPESTRFFKYVAVGALAFIVDYATTSMLVDVVPLIVANSLGFFVANVFNFFVAHGWVFGQAYTSEHLMRSYAAVRGVSAIGLLLNDAVVYVFVVHLGLALLPAKAIATVTVLLWNFLARVFFVYKR
jgi:putative flippase GtrA